MERISEIALDTSSTTGVTYRITELYKQKKLIEVKRKK